MRGLRAQCSRHGTVGGPTASLCIFLTALSGLSLALHIKGFSPECVLWCSTRLDFWLKPRPHSAHTRGFSPECVLWCRMRLDCWLKTRPQSLHTMGLCPECHFRTEQDGYDGKI